MNRSKKIVVINCTKKGAYILIFNGLLQLRNKKKKINIAEKKKNIKNYSEMSIDALIEEIQIKFITNFKRNSYEFSLNSYKGIYFHFQRSSIRQRGRGL